MKLLTAMEKAVAKKDFDEIWRQKMVRGMLVGLPLLLVVALPAMFLVLISFVPVTQINGMEQITALLPENLEWMNEKQMMAYAIINLLSPMFFLMIPLMTASVSASCSFVGEKERGTMETLLLTPLKVSRIFKAKVSCCMALSLLITAISFAAFFLVAAVGNLILGMPLFFDWSWLILVFLIAPSLTLFGVVLMVLVSGRSRSYMEAFQTSGYMVLPIILIFAGQLTGLFQLSPLLLLLAAVIFAILDLILWFPASRSFTPEKLLQK